MTEISAVTATATEAFGGAARDSARQILTNRSDIIGAVCLWWPDITGIKTPFLKVDLCAPFCDNHFEHQQQETEDTAQGQSSSLVQQTTCQKG